MNYKSKKIMIYTSWLTIPILVMADIILFHRGFYYFEGEWYKNKFLSTDGVKSIISFINYEGTNYGYLQLSNNKNIEISHFDSTVFKAANRLVLEHLSGLQLLCRAKQNDDASLISLDIIKFIKASPLNLKIENFGDLVKNVDSVHAYIEKNFLEKTDGAKVVRMDNTDYWCYIKKL